MRPCFGFENLQHIEGMRIYLESTLDTNIIKSDYLGVKVLFVPEEDYNSAITVGYDFILANKVKNVFIFDFYQMVKPIEEVPLLYAGISSEYTDDGEWNKKTEYLLNKIRNDIQTLIGKEIHYKQHLKKNVFFYILRKDIKEADHEEALEKITEYLKSCDTLLNVNLTTFFGRRICIM